MSGTTRRNQKSMRESVKIEAAGENDLAAIAELASVIWRACYPGMITVEQIDYMLGWMYAPDALREEIRHQQIRYPILRANNELIGFAAYGPTERRQVFKLHKLYVHPAWQHRGLGGRLLRHCEQEARSRGARQMILNVNKRNATAIPVYQRNGYAVVDSVVADIGAGFVMDDFVMAKDLTGPIM